MTVSRLMLTLFGISCIVLVVEVAFPTDKPTPKKGMQDVVAGQITNAEEAEELASQFSEDHAELERQLKHQLVSPKSKHHQVVIVYLLGLYRMDFAVRELAKVIILRAEPTRRKRLPTLGRYPAVDALIRIGMPSIRAVMERLETTDDKLVVELGTRVIDRILGRELGEIAIKQAIDKQDARDKRKNLEAALAFFKDKLRR